MDLWRSGSACDSSLFRDIHKVIRSNRVRFIRRSEARALDHDFYRFAAITWDAFPFASTKCLEALEFILLTLVNYHQASVNCLLLL